VHKAKGLEFPVVFVGSCTRGRFPVAQRGDPLELPAALAKDRLPAGDYHEQEERRLLYVAMTRARDELRFTAARDYGHLRPRRPSPFIAEALGPLAAPPVRPESPASVLARFAPSEEPTATLAPIPDEEIVTISRQALEDYLECPLKFKYGHVLRLPVPADPSAMYGAALHRAVAEYHLRRVAGEAVTLERLETVFRAAWVAEGFLSSDHAEQRLAQGLRVIQAFLVREEHRRGVAEAVERPFSFLLGRDRITGRWDLVEREDTGAVVIDYKSSDVWNPRLADERARASLQLDVYAVAYRRAFGEVPRRLELRFLESGLAGRVSKTEDDLQRTAETISSAARSIRARDYTPKPGPFTCGVCAYRDACPSAFR
jgi:DNA helicase-2/ATP-dependent DNA helicase PcrA